VSSDLRCGSWPTPVTSELVVRFARLPNGLDLDGDDVWWSEGRPEEGGRIAVLRRAPDGAVTEVVTAPWNARTAVHEYGGGAWWVDGGVLWFTDWATQRLHRVAPGDDPVALTPEPSVARGLRYADGRLSPDGTTLLCVQEEHHADGSEATNTIVRLDAHDASTPEVVAHGADFVADPRWRPDGGAFCWLEWDHPNMPWDAVRLVVDEGGERTVVAGGDRRESICQPTWATDGSLWFSGDRTGFWSIYRWTPAGGVEAMIDIGKDIGFPQWVFGETCFTFLDDGRVVFVYSEGGADRLATWDPQSKRVADLDVPHTMVEDLHAVGSAIVYVGASPTTEPHVVRVPIEADRAGAIEVLVPPRDLGLAPAWFSRCSTRPPTRRSPPPSGSARRSSS